MSRVLDRPVPVTTEEHEAETARIVEQLALRPEGNARPHHIREAEVQKGIDPLHALEVYLVRLPIVREVARAHGYAIGVHGSMKRDLDLIAAPWTEAASPPEVLARAIVVAVSGFVVKGSRSDGYRKPHGRLCWSIHLGGGPFIDLSVFPPLAEWTPGDPPEPTPDHVPVGDPLRPLDVPAKDPA